MEKLNTKLLHPDVWVWEGLPDLARYASTYPGFSVRPSPVDVKIHWRKYLVWLQTQAVNYELFIILYRKCGITLEQYKEMPYGEIEALLKATTALDEKVKSKTDTSRTLNDILDRHHPGGGRSSGSNQTFSETVGSSAFSTVMNRIKTNPLSMLK